MRKLTLPAIALLTIQFATPGMSAPQSLVPATHNTSPDYFCTWNIQGFYNSYESGPRQKDAVSEKQLFGQGLHENWLGQFAKVRNDLFIVLDEGWDLPEQQIKMVPGRFPSYVATTQPESFQKLSEAVKAKGWRGLGLWMHANKRTDEFWAERLQWMNAAGVSYWKVDYGDSEKDVAWRRKMTEMGHCLAPKLVIESALSPESITFADTFRTYDVDPLLSIPQTLERVTQALKFKAETPGQGLINCEDELYMGAALGCAYGVMRHEFTGNLPSGRQDFVFPPLTRDLKHCIDEVTRAVRWHRIAPAFGVGANAVNVSEEKLTDNWIHQKDESWRHAAETNVVESAPAMVTRGLPFPKVTKVVGDAQPYVVASRHPNGAVAIATLGRTLSPSPTDRRWITGEVMDVELEVGRNSGPIGIFGRYHSLTLAFDKPLGQPQIWAQDLAGESPEEVTRLVKVVGNRLTIPGALIDRVGLSAATKGDKSEPGMVLVVK